MPNRYSVLYEDDAKPLGAPSDGENVHKPTSPQVVKPTKPQAHKPTSRQIYKTTKPLVEKYTTHLPPETIKRIKLRAIEEEKSDYEIVLAAINSYLKDNK
jgi:hypothetical protein